MVTKMTTDEVIKLAREADPFGEHGRLYQVAELTPETLARFASLVRNAVLGEVIKIVEDFPIPVGNSAAADLAAIESLALAMESKMAEARCRGRTGWQSTPLDLLAAQLIHYLHQGRLVDAANFLAMLHARDAGHAVARLLSDPTRPLDTATGQITDPADAAFLNRYNRR